MEKITSKQGKVTFRDVIQSIIMTFLGAFLSTVYFIVKPIIDNGVLTGEVHFDWKSIILTGIGAGLAQLARKFLQDENGKLKITEKWKI